MRSDGLRTLAHSGQTEKSVTSSLKHIRANPVPIVAHHHVQFARSIFKLNFNALSIRVLDHGFAGDR